MLSKLALVSGIILSTPLFGQESDRSLFLKIGDPRFKEQTVEIAAGSIVSMETGKPVLFERMIQEMKPVPFVYLGETHNSLPMHQLQARIIRALYEQDRGLAVGLEMYPVTAQEPLSKWSRGLLTEDEFLREGRWYTTWNQNFAFYRPVFDFVKAEAIPLYALNAPREIITKIRMAGWDALTDEEKAVVPKPDLTNEDHRLLMRTIFSAEEMPAAMKGAGMEMMFEGLYRGQAAWEAVMARNAVRVHGLEGRKVIVLVGSGHLLYNLGLNRRAAEMSSAAGKTVIAVEVPKGKSALTVSRALADYVVGLAAEERPAYPSIGLSFKKIPDLSNLVIDKKPIDGAALGGDFEKGDVVLSVDGRTFSDVDELRIYLAGFDWGGEVKIRLLRAGLEKMVVLKLKETS
ncbi:MAG: ChaN family lipoprotein [Candidatus Aminicenantes bacterium]|nr:ChaN family lipoprotein [Candidatus Aminicenantes bacterium]